MLILVIIYSVNIYVAVAYLTKVVQTAPKHVTVAYGVVGYIIFDKWYCKRRTVALNTWIF